MSNERRLRIQHVIVQPVLLWDDGEEFEPGPELQPILMPASKLVEYAERLPDELAVLAESLAGEQQDQPST